jgi:hypothetical protein
MTEIYAIPLPKSLFNKFMFFLRICQVPVSTVDPGNGYADWGL